jgi:hypothetical protein
MKSIVTTEKKRKQEMSYEKEFSDEGLWGKIKNYAKSAGKEVIEKALWLYYAAQNPETPAWATPH